MSGRVKLGVKKRFGHWNSSPGQCSRPQAAGVGRVFGQCSQTLGLTFGWASAGLGGACGSLPTWVILWVFLEIPVSPKQPAFWRSPLGLLMPLWLDSRFPSKFLFLVANHNFNLLSLLHLMFPFSCFFPTGLLWFLSFQDPYLLLFLHPFSFFKRRSSIPSAATSVRLLSVLWKLGAQTKEEQKEGR